MKIQDKRTDFLGILLESQRTLALSRVIRQLQTKPKIHWLEGSHLIESSDTCTLQLEVPTKCIRNKNITHIRKSTNFISRATNISLVKCFHWYSYKIAKKP